MARLGEEQEKRNLGVVEESRGARREGSKEGRPLEGGVREGVPERPKKTTRRQESHFGLGHFGSRQVLFRDGLVPEE